MRLIKFEIKKIYKRKKNFRNSRRELNDIRFEFITGKDTSEGIAGELVGAGLVDPLDSVPISTNLAKLLAQRNTPTPVNTVTFHLVSISYN